MAFKDGASRRQFLAMTAASCAVAVVGLRAKADPADEYGGLPMGIQSYTLRHIKNFDELINTVSKELKLKRIELTTGHLSDKLTPEAIAEAKAKLKALDLTVDAFGVQKFTKNADANRKLFEFGKTLGVKQISADPDPDSFESLDKLVEEFKIGIGIHPHGPGHRYGKLEQITAAIKDHHKLIGICADTGHLIRSAEDPLAVCDTLKDRLQGLHLKDFIKDPATGKFKDCIIGEGSLKVDALIKFLIDQKFNGSLSIEYEGGDPVATVQKTLEKVKAAVKAAGK